MFAIRCLCTFSLLAALAPCVGGADLTKIDRKIVHEPKYQSKAPKYCLLVFGPEAKTRIWLVQDGPTLYVDRNGNGDLTEPGERVEATKDDDRDLAQEVYNFDAGDLVDGKLLHKNLRLRIWKLDRYKDGDEQIAEVLKKHPRFRARMVSLDVEQPGFRGVGEGGRLVQSAGYSDLEGFLHFGDRPANAPIIHFRGPWHIVVNRRMTWTIGCKEEIVCSLGTPGLGAGTTVLIGYEGVIPEDVHPRAEIVFQSSKPGEAPIKEIIELKARC